jgi:Fic family protein
MKEEDVPPQRRDDRQEVLNYIDALNAGIKELQKIPLSMRLLKGVHKILLQGVRGEHKAPGEVRHTQNWIGGSSLQDAYYIPPHQLDVPELLTDLEIFWHNKNLDLPPLIKAALSHYQFESIHPFLDGNGRLGRLLITLLLIAEGRLDKPVLYLSDFFDRNRGSYYDSLTLVRSSNDIEQWLRFFLQGVSETATTGKKVLSDVVDLRSSYTDRIHTKISSRRKEKALELLTFLYGSPYVAGKDVEKALNITHPTANALIEELVDAGLLKEVTGYKRNRLYHLWEYQALFTPLTERKEGVGYPSSSWA